MDTNPLDESFIEKLHEKAKNFFEQNGNITSKEEFDPFLNSIGLWEIWDNDEEKEAIWETLVNYKNSDHSIDYEAAIKGLNELLNVKENENEENNLNLSSCSSNTSDEVLSPAITQKRREQRHVTETFCKIDIWKVIQLKKIFILLELKDKSEISITEIKEWLRKHHFITLTIDEVMSFIKEIGVEFENDEKGNKEKIYINGDYYHRAFRTIEAKVSAYTEAEEKKTISELVIGIDKDYNVRDSHDPNVICNILDLIQDITAHEHNTIDYTSILKEMKATLSDLSSNYFHMCDKLHSSISHDDQIVLVKSKNSWISKFELLENNAKEILKVSNWKLKQLEELQEHCMKLDNNFTLVKEQMTHWYRKYHSNQKMELDDEMERWLDENIILSRDKEDKALKIKNLEKENFEYEKIIQELNWKAEEFETDKDTLQQEIVKLQREKDLIKQEYDHTVDKVLAKINEDEKCRKEIERHRSSLTLNLNSIDEISQYDTSNGEGTITPKKRISFTDDDYSLSMLEESLKNGNQNWSSLTYDKLLSYTLKIDMDNKHWTSNVNEFENKMNKLERELNEVKRTHKNDLVELSVWSNENNRLQNKICELWKDVEINNKFRPTSAMINSVKLQSNSKFRNLSQSSNNMTDSINERKNNKKNIKIKGDYHKLNAFVLKNKLKIASLKNKLDSNASAANEKDKSINPNHDQVNFQEKLQPIEEGIVSDTSLAINKENINSFENVINLEDNNNKVIDTTLDLTKNVSVRKSDQNWLENIDITEAFDNPSRKLRSSMINIIPKISIQSENNSFDKYSNKEKDSNLSTKDLFFNQNKSSKRRPRAENENVNPLNKKLFNKRMSIPTLSTHFDNSLTLEECMFGFNMNGKEMKTAKTRQTKPKKMNCRKRKSEIWWKTANDNAYPINSSKIMNEDYSNDIKYYNLEDSDNINIAINRTEISSKSPRKMNNSYSKSIKPLQSSSYCLTVNTIVEEEKTKDIKDEKAKSINLIRDKVPFSESNTLSKLSPRHTEVELRSKLNITNTWHTRYKTSSEFFPQISEENNYDFLSLSKNKLLQKIWNTKKDTSWPEEIYSDSISKIVNGKGIRHNIIITRNGIFLLSLNMTLSDYIPKDSLEKVTIPYNNYNFIAIHIKDNKNDLLISSLRRLKMWEYLKEYYREKNSKILKFQFLNNFSFKVDGKSTEIKINQTPTVESNLDGAKKFGYWYKYTKGIFKNSFTEYLVALTGIGLMVFVDLNKPPINFIPILGSSINILDGTKYQKHCLFEIVNSKGNKDIFSTNSKEELDSWYKILLDVQDEYQNKLKKLDKANKGIGKM